jgi:hypothetical protein
MTSIVIYNVEKPCFTSVIGYLIDDVEVCGTDNEGWLYTNQTSNRPSR